MTPKRISIVNAGRVERVRHSYLKGATRYGGTRMLESIVELLCDLFLCALTVMISSLFVGSMVAALRAVSRGSATRFGCLAGVTISRDHDQHTPVQEHILLGEIHYG
jgi:ribosomal protein L19